MPVVYRGKWETKWRRKFFKKRTPSWPIDEEPAIDAGAVAEFDQVVKDMKAVWTVEAAMAAKNEDAWVPLAESRPNDRRESAPSKRKAITNRNPEDAITTAGPSSTETQRPETLRRNRHADERPTHVVTAEHDQARADAITVVAPIPGLHHESARSGLHNASINTASQVTGIPPGALNSYLANAWPSAAGHGARSHHGSERSDDTLVTEWVIGSRRRGTGSRLSSPSGDSTSGATTDAARVSIMNGTISPDPRRLMRANFVDASSNREARDLVPVDSTSPHLSRSSPPPGQPEAPHFTIFRSEYPLTDDHETEIASGAVVVPPVPVDFAYGGRSYPLSDLRSPPALPPVISDRGVSDTSETEFSSGAIVRVPGMVDFDGDRARHPRADELPRPPPSIGDAILSTRGDHVAPVDDIPSSRRNGTSHQNGIVPESTRAAQESPRKPRIIAWLFRSGRS